MSYRERQVRVARGRGAFGAANRVQVSERPWWRILGRGAGGVGRPAWMDHPETWERGGQVVALTAHVYFPRLGSDAFRALWLEQEHDVVVRVGSPGESWHAPGQTVLVEVWRRAAAPRRLRRAAPPAIAA